jgi:hypothetical protein
MHDKQVCMFVSCELPDAEGVRFSVLWVHLVHLVHRVLLHRRAKWSAKWSVRPGQGFGKFDSTCFDILIIGNIRGYCTLSCVCCKRSRLSVLCFAEEVHTTICADAARNIFINNEHVRCHRLLTSGQLTHDGY